MNVVMCRSSIPGLIDGAGVFETPWRVAVPVVVTDPKLIETSEDAALVPAAELEEWEREKSEFERALDEDNVLFDIDDPGFIFFDTSSSSEEVSSSVHALGGDDAMANAFQRMQQQDIGGVLHAGNSSAVFDVAARAAALAPVKITAKVPDFSDVVGPQATRQTSLMDTSIDYMFSMPMFLDAMHERTAYTEFSIGDTASTSQTAQRPCTRSNSVTTYSPCATPRNVGAPSGSPWAPIAVEPSEAGRGVASRKRHGNVQHFVPQHSSICSRAGSSSNGELSSGWQFISTPRDPKLHVPTLLEQHA
ncbi:hypothetical protein EV175_006778, partial [Coemansia sp. RSA 1933]